MAGSEDIESIIDELSPEELRALSDEIDPEHELLPVHERQLQPPSNYKFNINDKIKEMEKMSIESIEGDNYLPLHARNWKKPEAKPKKKEKEEEIDVLPDEWNEMLDSANEKQLAELAGFLGIHSMLTQEESQLDDTRNMNERLQKLNLKPATERYEPSKDVKDYYGEQIDVTAVFRRLKSFDKELTEITLNNMKEIDDVLLAVAEFLSNVETVKKISVANTRMTNAIGLKFAEALKKNNSLTFLNMESNYLSGEVIVAILTALENNKTLTELKLSNQSKVAGAHNEREIVKQLEKNHTLRKFGFAFFTPGIGNAASRLILRNNDEARKARRSMTKE